MTGCQFVPPFLLERISRARPSLNEWCQRTLALDAELRGRRTTVGAVVHTDAWTIYDAESGTLLPGTRARGTGDPATGDAAVDEAYDGVQASLALFREVYDRASFDDNGAEVTATVHYGQNYDNAFWDGTQLVFGDGDGEVFVRFTKAVDVLAHEFTHAVVQHTANLVYQGQPGALNESVCDVFASCMKQRLLGQQADEADWLIGAGIFTDQVEGRALRSMAEPGTAYDDDVLGKDPQGGSMADYVETTEDNGGVHINSGIANRAFHLAATGIGGSSWEGAGRIWYAALTSGIGASTDFAGFAAACVAAAPPETVDVVREAWRTVGVFSGTASSSEPASDRVEVRRTGGFAGISRSGQVALGSDPRTSEIESLLGRIDLRAVMASTPQPDRFVYVFVVRGTEVRVGEQDLTPELDRLAQLVLGG